VTAPSTDRPDIDSLADAGRWTELLDLCRTRDPGSEAADRRRIGHILAVEAPVHIAAAAVELFADDDRAHLGPLWEVIADGRPWPELTAHLEHPRTRHLAAHSRVLQGEDLSWDPSLDPALLGVPFVLQPWEAEQWDTLLDMPGYSRNSAGGTTVAAFPDDFANPEAEVETEELPAARPRQAGHDALPLLADLSPWVRAYAFHGTAWEAASAVASERTVRRGAVFPFSRAYRCLVHLAAGSSAYGMTSGQAVGRVAVWRALTAMAGADRAGGPEGLAAFVGRVHCVGWEEPGDRIWRVHLAVEDPEQGVSWVLSGQDWG
jgi:hypothetical protein